MYSDFVVFDFGCIISSYCSDMARTIVIGEPEEQHLLIYDLVLKAQLESLARCTGKKGSEIDAIAGHYYGCWLRRVFLPWAATVWDLKSESPRLSKADHTVLQPGMVVTVEPGVYLPGFGGVRIEDLVVVREDGHEVLTSTFKELYIVD